MTKHNIISVSGGKDSTALLLLAIERQPENLQAVLSLPPPATSTHRPMSTLSTSRRKYSPSEP